MYKKVLKVLFASLLSLGFFLALFPFVKSLHPNDAHLIGLPYVDVSNIEEGGTKIISITNAQVMVTKGAEFKNGYRVLYMPYSKGKYLLPEMDWNRPFLKCESFVHEDGYYCIDTNKYGELWFNFMKWDFEGKYIGDIEKYGVVPDIISPEFEIKTSELILLQM